MWKEKQFEEKMRVYIDQIYKKIFSNLIEIKRYDRDHEDQKAHFMDIELGIDTILAFKNGSILTFQEKTRKNYFLKYNDFTFEYYNDPNTKEIGEWFKLASQLYFYGFSNENEDGYSKYYIIIVPLFRLYLNSKDENWINKHTKENRFPAKANFIWIPFNDISKNCFLDNEINNKGIDKWLNKSLSEVA